MENTKATVGQRFLAVMIDGIVSSIPYYILLFIAPSLALPAYAISLIYLLLKDVLVVPAIGLDAQSYGKKIMGIKVVKGGTSIANDYAAGIIRGVTLIIPLLNIVDCFMVFSADGKRFGDKWANTEVVKA